MAARKTNAGRERPLSLDELATLDDVAAAKPVPADVASALASRRLSLAGAGKQLKPSRPAGEDVWDLELPPGSFLGRPGLTGKRLAQRARSSAAAATEPMRPPWVAQVHQARVASESFRQSPMRRINGKQVEPYYGVYGADDRRVFYPGSYPWRCIGRIFTWTNWAGGGGWSWWGSGVLVGPRHVLTAGHVCPWGSGSWAMRFVPNDWNGAPALGAGAQSWTSDFRGWNTNNTVAAHDIAVLRLYDPIGSWLGWMGSKTYDSGWNGGAYWTLAGYPAASCGRRTAVLPVGDPRARRRQRRRRQGARAPRRRNRRRLWRPLLRLLERRPLHGRRHERRRANLRHAVRLVGRGQQRRSRRKGDGEPRALGAVQLAVTRR